MLVVNIENLFVLIEYQFISHGFYLLASSVMDSQKYFRNFVTHYILLSLLKKNFCTWIITFTLSKGEKVVLFKW